ncbi:MAG TPA: LysM peptidoglycan-binding domain-containing protein [Desulfuromonadaceae bacterium]|nr:LysM peptidoglycan-binding domain-containing protein [Desulfuromonadaceae bacterium]
MNQPNPFVPQGSLLEQHKRRSRVKLAVFCTLAISVCGLMAMLIEGCRRETPPAENTDTTLSTNSATMLDTNPPVTMGSNAMNTLPPPPTIPEPATGETYVVVKGDTLGKIATSHHTTVKAIEDANPGVTPTRLKVGQKITLPAGSSAGATEATPTAAAGSGETYVVKSGDSLTKIATSHGVTLKALKAANPNLDPNKIRVGQKIIIPSKAEAPTTQVNTPPAPVSAPAPAPANGQ